MEGNASFSISTLQVNRNGTYILAFVVRLNGQGSVDSHVDLLLLCHCVDNLQHGIVAIVRFAYHERLERRHLLQGIANLLPSISQKRKPRIPLVNFCESFLR